MTVSYEKFVPTYTAMHIPFWEGLKTHHLVLQRCDSCTKFRFTPKEICPYCHGREWTWTPVSGKGTVYTFSVVHRAPMPAYQADVPYVIAHVEIPEGPRIMSNLVHVDPEAITIGMPVQVLFEDVTPELTLFKWEPAR